MQPETLLHKDQSSSQMEQKTVETCLQTSLFLGTVAVEFSVLKVKKEQQRKVQKHLWWYVGISANGMGGGDGTIKD